MKHMSLLLLYCDHSYVTLLQKIDPQDAFKLISNKTKSAFPLNSETNCSSNEQNAPVQLGITNPGDWSPRRKPWIHVCYTILYVLLHTSNVCLRRGGSRTQIRDSGQAHSPASKNSYSRRRTHNLNAIHDLTTGWGLWSMRLPHQLTSRGMDCPLTTMERTHDQVLFPLCPSFKLLSLL